MPAKKNFPLRIDPQLYAALEQWAADELRSVNAHIEFLLREAVRRTGRLHGHSAETSLQDNLADNDRHKKK
ncbi:MAG: type II toxin-antitoxin system antitoxin [Bacillota bacterium]